METPVVTFLENATSKALATMGPTGLNVVPVSSLKVVDGKIWLINYFMDKTIQNILTNRQVALTAWIAMMGYQIKGAVDYQTEGVEFDQAVAWIHEMLPDRIVRGLLILTPTEIHDIAPTKNTKEKFETSLIK